MRRILLWIWLTLPGIAAGAAADFAAFDSLETAPPGVLQFYPSVFAAPRILAQHHWEAGDVALLQAGEHRIQVWIFPVHRPENVLALHPWLLDTLRLAPGRTDLLLFPLKREDWRLAPERWERYMEPYPGDLRKWRGFVVGAPHGDCDLYTAEIARGLNTELQIPTLAAFHYRISYYGRWIDVNRPLARLPRWPEGVMPERVFWEPAAEVYHQWQNLIWQVARVEPWEQLDFYCSFHGHDLKVRKPDGTRIPKLVVEAMGSGFTLDELRRLKEKYYAWAPEYFSEPPLLVFGNLPEDRSFNYRGLPTTFFYSGYGARQYGALRRDLTRRALHFETPNTLRFDPQERAKTVKLFGRLFSFVHDSLWDTTRFVGLNTIPEAYRGVPQRRVTIPAGEFIMGAPENQGWSAERPQHRVYLDAYALDYREVTLGEYADYLNEVFAQGLIVVSEGKVLDRAQPDHILAALDSWKPLSQISYHDGRFTVTPGREWFPAFYVSWYGARAYARCHGGDLPTEAQWEKAAGWDPAAEHKWVYGTADTVDYERINCDNSGDPYEHGVYPWTTPVGYYAWRLGTAALSPLGLADMNGNVSEWCRDWYQYGYYKTDPPAQNPAGPETATMKTFRGGAWSHEFPAATTTFRVGMDPNLTMIDVGFRCAYPVEREE